MKNKNRFIFLGPNPTQGLLLVLSLFFHIAIYAQQRKSVEGNVSDYENGEPLPGVTVVVKGSSIGTTTDFDGNFSIEIPKNKTALIFSYIGYQPHEIIVDEGGSYEY